MRNMTMKKKLVGVFLVKLKIMSWDSVKQVTNSKLNGQLGT